MKTTIVMIYRLHSLLRLGTLLSLALTPSCGDPSEEAEADGPQFIQRTIDNKGSVCLSPDDNEQISVDVVFKTCLSSSCDHPDSATCTAKLEGDELLVTSQLTITSKTGNIDCTADCGSAKVACGVVSPAGARVRVVHGAEDPEAVVLPLAEATEVPGPSPGYCAIREPAAYFQ